MKKTTVFIFAWVVCFLAEGFTNIFLAEAAVNPSTREIGVGQMVTLNGEQFVKVNNNGLLMMTSTYSCPRGKKIGHEWVECFLCDNDEHGYYDYNLRRCNCNSGYNYRSSDTKCIACPANSNWNGSEEVCKCSANYYMQGDNANCQSCPANSTSGVGSTAFSDCICNRGYYHDNNSCTACPPGATTMNPGSTSISDCVCGIGYVADSGTNSCIIDTTNYSATLDTYYDATNCSDPVAWMDEWTGCSSLETILKDESVTEEQLAVKTVCLLDPRDHRSYRVRRFDDDGTEGQSSGDKCWTIDSLRFGGNYGEIDGCSAYSGEGNFTYAWCGGSSTGGCTRGGSNNATKAQETFSTGYYGHCRAINSTYNNYLYDWVAAMQSTLAYFGSSTTFPGVQQGLCPTGWHLPTGTNDTSGEYQMLANRYGTGSSAVTNFWTNSIKWAGSFSGIANSSSGALDYQGSSGNYWSSSVKSSSSAYFLGFYSGYVDPSTYSDKHNGRVVRCIKD